MYIKNIYSFSGIDEFQFFLVAIFDFRKSKFQLYHVTRGIKRSNVSKFHGPTIYNGWDYREQRKKSKLVKN